MNFDKAKIRISKILDEYAGGLVILFFLLFKFFRPEKPPPASVRKILVIKFWGIGSIILFEPALRALYRTYPHVEIQYLTLRQNEDLFALIPSVKKVYALAFANPAAVLLKSIALIHRLRNEKFDLILDAEFFVNYSAIMARLAGGKCIVGFARSKGIKNHLLHVAVPFLDGLHTTEQFLRLVQDVPLSRADFASPRLLLESNGVLRTKRFSNLNPYVVININASPLATERRWPRERFTELARALLETYEFDVVLIGSKSERVYVAPAAQALENPQRVRNLAGELNLVELADVLKHAILFISNDSGPIHLAAALQIPVVGFYGPETPRRYGPLTPKRLVFYQHLWCSPCMSVDNAKTVNCINHLACMKEIETEVVIARVCRFIDEVILPDWKSELKSDQNQRKEKGKTIWGKTI